jgi:hypothetical protein
LEDYRAHSITKDYQKNFLLRKKQIVVSCISSVQLLLSLGQIYIPRLTSLLSFSKRGKFINQEKKKKKNRRNPVKPLTQIEGQDGLEHELEREITIILQTPVTKPSKPPKTTCSPPSHSLIRWLNPLKHMIFASLVTQHVHDQPVIDKHELPSPAAASPPPPPPPPAADAALHQPHYN